MTTPLLRRIRAGERPARSRRVIDETTLREAGAILSDIGARGEVAVLFVSQIRHCIFTNCIQVIGVLCTDER